jgi:hypothetical protein
MPITVVPAHPGYSVIYADGIELVRGEPVIAWAIDAERQPDDVLFATAVPITPEGSPAKGWVAIECPDKSVTMYENQYDTFAAAAKEHSSRGGHGAR